MKNGEYWAARFKALEETRYRSDKELLNETEKLYAQAKKEIEEKIAYWYTKFAKNNQISMSEAKRLLKSDELKEFKWTVEDYIKHGENNFDDSFTKQLINASSRVHISRYEALLTELKCKIETLTNKQESLLTEHLKEAYSENYYHTAFEVAKGTGVGVRLGGVDERQLDAVLKKPWTADGSVFSDRIWKDKNALLSEINTQLTRNIAMGKGPDEAIEAIAKRFDTSKYNAGRLVMTESAAISAKARQDCFNALDVEEFEVVETLDGHTCEICGEMDGKHFPMSEYEIGVTAPVFHPNCRGTTCPYFDDMEDYGERIARDLEGNTFYVPANTTYKEWKQMQDEKYGDGSVDKIREMHYNEKADREQYEKYKKLLGNDAPKTFSDFRELKYSDDEYYDFLKLDYQRRNKLKKNPELALPNAEKATADDKKFTGYLFNPESSDGYAKGKAFTSRLGYDKDNFSELKQEVLSRAKIYPAVFKGKNQYGDRYEQKMIIYGKKDAPANVVVGWLRDQDNIKMTSTYIKEVD